MTRISVDIPDSLKQRADVEAKRRGVSLDDVVQTALLNMLNRAGKPDPMLDDDFRYEGEAPSDLSANLDKHLYGEIDDAVR